MLSIALIIILSVIVSQTILIMMEPGGIMYNIGSLIDKIPEDRYRYRLIKKLLTCPKCIGGQIAFWYYLFNSATNYNLIIHICITATTIWIGHITERYVFR